MKTIFLSSILLVGLVSCVYPSSTLEANNDYLRYNCTENVDCVLVLYAKEACCPSICQVNVSNVDTLTQDREWRRLNCDRRNYNISARKWAGCEFLAECKTEVYYGRRAVCDEGTCVIASDVTVGPIEALA
mgnify:CR=1 FL=1